MKNKMRVILILIAFVTTLSYTSDIIPKHKLKLSVDFARFYGDEERIFVETYYSVRTDEFTYIYSNEKYIGGVNVYLTISNNGNVVEQHEWTIPSVETDSTIIQLGKTLVSLRAFFLAPGTYEIRVVTEDFNNLTRRDSLVYPLQLDPIPSDRDAISDIELCSSIRQIPTDEKNVFYKNTLEVVPNPSLLYGTGLPIIYYYFEAYNLTQDKSTNEYIVKVSLIDAFSNQVFNQEKTKKRVNNSSVEIGTINTTSLKAGTYLLRAEIIDTVKNTVARSMKRVFIYKPSKVDSVVTLETGDVVSSEYAVMNHEEILTEFETASYIASNEEKTLFSLATDINAKRKFIYDFWKRRDIDPMTSENEFKIEYQKRVAYANDNFTSSFRKGWNTDRGRVYIIYGPPDDIERYPSSYDAEPYEIWNYNSLQGGVIFIFIDRTGQGDYRLVHSNHRNELQDENWYNKVKKAR